ncbi:hypothetical protein LBMAG53_24810 [Planctomycetota bacterium]|nr:hypothetical protein LBMAG53_24810 [Planctomycetota bacterium]
MSRTIMAMLIATVLGLAEAGELPPLNPSSATWYIGLDALWGQTKKGEARSFNMYQVFLDGKPVNALGVAEKYNGSMHFIEKTVWNVDLPGKSLTGSMQVLITPDPWVPASGELVQLAVELRGTLREEGGTWLVSGTYTAKRVDGKPFDEQRVQAEGDMRGACFRNEGGWGDSVWRAQMSQVRQPGVIDRDAIDLTLGISEGRVRWGLIGLTAEPAWPASKRLPIDVSGFGPVTDVGIAAGPITVSARHLHPGGDPAEQVRVDVTMHLVQGFCGGELVIAPTRSGVVVDAPTRAYGKGSATKGGGAEAPKGLWMFDIDPRPWWKPIAGFTPPAADEHPRLLFRKADVPALRQRAQTAEGKAILARLRKLLDGKDGENLPTVFSDTLPANHRSSKPLPIGAFTSWHAMGYGFLYQITGEAKYAELSRQCVQLMFDGKFDIDNRYSWIKPGTDLRCGTVLSAMAYAYDFSFDAWPDDFRRQVAREIETFDKVTASGLRTSLAYLSGRSKYPPGSNHYGSLIGGTGVALLAIRGDTGVDSATITKRLEECESNLPRMFELGFGDAGWFAEGFGASSALSRIPVQHLLWAERIAHGRDYLTPRPNASWLTRFWIMHLGGEGWGCIPNRGVYEGDNGVPRDGEMPASFASIEPQYVPALLFSYDTFMGSREPKEKLGCAPDERSWGTARYPHGAVFAFIAWPIGIEPRNPAEVMPKVAVDRVQGYFVARERWQDADDLIVTHWLEYGPRGYYSSRDTKGDQRAGTVRIWGRGLRTGFSTGIIGGPVTAFAEASDGSFAFTRGSAATRSEAALAVDFSRASGAELVIVAVGTTSNNTPTSGAKATTQVVSVKLGAVPVQVFTLQTGPAPAVSVDGDAIVVGGQRFSWDGTSLRPAVFAVKPAP